jgi:beta-N-acetylhexosaminidase
MKTKNTLIGPIMADISGMEMTAEDREVLRHPLIGGVILFARNYRDRAQLEQLCDALRTLKKPRLLLATDHEGGRVQRFREGFTRVPPMRSLGAFYADDPAGGRAYARTQGASIARELGSLGIDLCFAPVLDLDQGLSQVIGDRAFSDKPKDVISLAKAFCAGLASGGMAATGKHFPGHGAVVADSHKELPIDNRPLAQIEKSELAPFKAMIAARIPSLMMAHVRYTAVDQTPASLSKLWIGAYLRRKLGFRGAVFCDDLSMGGAAAVGSMQERARMALDAGCDMLPVCNDRPALLKLLDDLAGLKPSPAKSARLKSLYLRNAQ